MKSYDETVNTVFDRIHTYQVKKQKHTAITRRIAASCCAVSLLGGGVWYVNRHPMDTPIKGIATGDNTTTAKASDTVPTSPTTTHPTEDKIIITADEPEQHGNLTAADWPPYIISPALEEKMALHKSDDVFYYVIVEIYISVQDDHELVTTDEELIQLAQRKNAAFIEWIAILKKDNPAGRLESGKWAIVSDEARVKEKLFLAIADEYARLLEQKRTIYFDSLRAQRAQELQTVSSIAPISISTDSRFTPYFASNSNYAFFMTLTSDEINALSNLTGYIIRLAYPNGDGINSEGKSSSIIS